MAEHKEEDAKLLQSKEASDKLTLFAPFEASRSVSTSLPYKGQRTKPPQVEITDTSYLSQPKVLFRKLRSTAPTSSTRDSDKGSTSGSQPFTDSRGGGGGSKRVRMVGSEQEKEGRGNTRETDSGRTPSVRVTKSLVLNRIGTLEKDQVCVSIFYTAVRGSESHSV